MTVNLDKFKIKELMAKNKISSQSELARMLGISKTQLSFLLSNKFIPIKSNVIEIANFFNVNPFEIMKNSEKARKLKTK